jgi:hypothetical protein
MSAAVAGVISVASPGVSFTMRAPSCRPFAPGSPEAAPFPPFPAFTTITV